MPKGKRKKGLTKYDAYSNYLASQPWTWFCTMTTGYELTLKSARRLVERTTDNWKKLDPDVRVFWAAERFECKDGYHLHALVYAPTGPKNIQAFVETYQAMVGNKVVANNGGKLRFDAWARIDLRKFNPKRAAAKYLVPYMFKEQSKGQGADYDWR